MAGNFLLTNKIKGKERKKAKYEKISKLFKVQKIYNQLI